MAGQETIAQIDDGRRSSARRSLKIPGQRSCHRRHTREDGWSALNVRRRQLRCVCGVHGAVQSGDDHRCPLRTPSSEPARCGGTAGRAAVVLEPRARPARGRAKGGGRGGDRPACGPSRWESVAERARDRTRVRRRSRAVAAWRSSVAVSAGRAFDASVRRACCDCCDVRACCVVQSLLWC
eukprot:2786289-Prymnesium_polylepis.1